MANETFLFDATWTAGGRRHEQACVLRLSAESPLYLDADLDRHRRMYEILADVPGVPVPRVLAFEPDPELLDGPFFVMERVAGAIPADHPHYSESGFVADANPAQRRQLWEDAVDVLARLHQVDTGRLGFLEREPAVRTGLDADLAHWRRSQQWAEEGRVDELLEIGWEWLDANRPTGAEATLSWGDARIGNMIFRDQRCVAVLDWDTVSLAGDRADLAWWIIMQRGADRLDGIGTPREFLDRWEARTGRQVGDLHWWLVFTTYRLGVILLRRYRQAARDGRLPADQVEVAARRGPAQQLALLLDLQVSEPITVTLPDIER